MKWNGTLGVESNGKSANLTVVPFLKLMEFQIIIGRRSISLGLEKCRKLHFSISAEQRCRISTFFDLAGEID